MVDTISIIRHNDVQPKTYLSWEEYINTVQILIKSLKSLPEDKKPKSVYGIPRGGLMIAQMVSYALDIPLILLHEEIEYNTVVVDDIVDSGLTVENLVAELDVAPMIASLHWRSISSEEPDIYVIKLTTEEWIVYPYEEE